MTDKPKQDIKPNLTAPVIRELEVLDRIYTLRSLDDSYQITEKHIEEIVSACNEELIYRFLFRSGLQGKKYSENDAVEFVQWAKRGWRDGVHFVFLILDAADKIIGCIDISSDDIEQAPIGYWKTAGVKRIMPVVVKCLLDIAAAAGYKNLYAMVEPVNTRSSNLLKKSGFNLLGIRSLEMKFMGAPTGEYKLFEVYELILAG
jgi:RimJ/RimL family protein N-acetyltransferase